MAEKKNLDQYYTAPEMAEQLVRDLNLNDYDLIIEPSAGTCSFYNLLPEDKRVGIDIEPKCEDVIHGDFLQWEPENTDCKILTIGNPPFGRNSSIALKFINRSAKWSDKIAFILPKSFKKQSMYDKINLNFWKVLEHDLPKNSFIYENKRYDVPCVWLVLEKRTEKRIKEVRLLPNDFIFTTRLESNCAVRRVGVTAGFASSNTDVAEPSHYFVRAENLEEFLHIINSLNWTHNNTLGPRSISKNELISAYNESKNNRE